MAIISLRSTIHPTIGHATPSNYILTPRAEDPSANTTTQTCITLTSNQIVITRPTLIATLTAFSLITLIALILLLNLLHRCYQRKKQTQAAKTWGHKSRFDHRISMMRKEVDDAYSRQYGPGCLTNPIPENPEMGSDSPVEMGTVERVWEVPFSNAKSGSGTRRDKAKSLFFDYGVGVWMPKR